MWLWKFQTEEHNFKWKDSCCDKKKIQKNLLLSYKINTTFYYSQKKKILNLVRNNEPTKINSGIIEFELIDKKSNVFKIFFDQSSFEFRGWETIDAYSNKVSFKINDVKTNKIIEDDFFKIPREKDL